MKRYLTLEELQHAELETMKCFRDYCIKHQLQYYLACGTLLGAVRHQGFIPWDDDIDIYMPRRDYEYLLVHFHEEGSNRHRIISWKSDSKFYFNYAKLVDTATVLISAGCSDPIGAFIDIFPMDYYPKSPFAKLRYYRFWLLNIVYLSYDKMDLSGHRTLKRAILFFLVKRIYPSREQLGGKVRRLWEQIIKQPPNNAYTLVYRDFGYLPKLPKQWFDPTETLLFEGEAFSAPKEYRKYLTAAYGRDYMQLPPEEKRVSHHSFECYWAEDRNDQSTDIRRI